MLPFVTASGVDIIFTAQTDMATVLQIVKPYDLEIYEQETLEAAKYTINLLPDHKSCILEVLINQKKELISIKDKEDFALIRFLMKNEQSFQQVLAGIRKAISQRGATLILGQRSQPAQGGLMGKVGPMTFKENHTFIQNVPQNILAPEE